ncbi:MAG TPA: 50S ribosomal protein L20, partial [Patescibacteria group bacterium]
MARVKTGSTTHRRHKKILERTKGFKLGRNSLFR